MPLRGAFSNSKRVVYVVVDGMSTEAFEQVTASGRAPALAAIKERATYVRDSVATFPTITPCATAALVTGALPAEHGIPGMCWYDRSAQRFVNYGQSPRAAVIEGVSQIVEDVLVNLNEKHLSADVETLHESLDEMGYLSASINFMVFRGPHVAELRPNLLERLFFRRALPARLAGPKEHYFADVVRGSSKAGAKVLSVRGLEKRIKATDAWAACVTRDLLSMGTADMILFYLHENDHASHRSGPAAQTESLATADAHVAYVLDTFGSWEATLDQTEFVVTADHSQSPVEDDDDHILELRDILDGFSSVEPDRGREPFGDNDLAAAGNGRVGFLYLNEARREALRIPVVEALLECPGIDQAMWAEEDLCHVRSAAGHFWFRRDAAGKVEDERGNRWAVGGDLGPVSGVIEEDIIRTPEYPLALWRIRSALDLDRCGDVIATARIGYELKDLAGGHHKGGGDHGSLHAQDSLVPFMSTLRSPPLHPATTDVAPHVLDHFRSQA